MAEKKSDQKSAGKAASTKSAKPAKSEQDQATSTDDLQSTRETVESIVVAFVLAFLFRAFVAEAFVIPTGSMAPTLMGAHKDLTCEFCGQPYQANASSEYDSATGRLLPYKTVASNCANCRLINAYDFQNNKNHATFSGDRILVSKFDYVLSSPQRWDVLVFKYPIEARTNYIKRLIGLPGETIRILHGDILLMNADTGEIKIARKPPHKIQAMKQVVSDTSYVPKKLVEQGWPSSWQPLPDQQQGWNAAYDGDAWSAKLAANSEPQWLRYYHKFPTNEDWEKLTSGEQINVPDPHTSTLITDFLAYNSQVTMNNALDMFEEKENSLKGYLPRRLGGLLPNPAYAPIEEKLGGKRVFEAILDDPTVGITFTEVNDGIHWVGDLTGRFEVEVQSDSGELMLDLVEHGIHFECAIDLATGEAVLRAWDETGDLPVFGGETTLNASTGVRGTGTYAVELANFDDRIVLWVDGSVVEFNQSGDYDLTKVRGSSALRPHWSQTDPLDAAPVGIGGRSAALRVKRAQVYRDIYYVAVQPQGSYCDFKTDMVSLRAAMPPSAKSRGLLSLSTTLAAVYGHPEWWDQTPLFESRQARTYTLDAGQYFPLGDNSSASSDARAWSGHHYVEEKFLLGKALLVFWPHTWNTPVPFTPNIARMGLIR